MQKGVKFHTSDINITLTESGESIEQKMRRVTTTNEPIENVAPLIYTERKDGVLAEYDIRTDRFEVAQSAMDKVTRSKLAKREEVNNTTQPNENE